MNKKEKKKMRKRQASRRGTSKTINILLEKAGETKWQKQRAKPHTLTPHYFSIFSKSAPQGFWLLSNTQFNQVYIEIVTYCDSFY